MGSLPPDVDVHGKALDNLDILTELVRSAAVRRRHTQCLPFTGNTF